MNIYTGKSGFLLSLQFDGHGYRNYSLQIKETGIIADVKKKSESSKDTNAE